MNDSIKVKEARKNLDEAIDTFVSRDRRIVELQNSYEEYEKLVKDHPKLKQEILDAVDDLSDAINGE